MENRIKEKMEETLQLIREYAHTSGWQRIEDMTTASYRALEEIERREDE
jgi:hypothetical protein